MTTQESAEIVALMKTRGVIKGEPEESTTALGIRRAYGRSYYQRNQEWVKAKRRARYAREKAASGNA